MPERRVWIWSHPLVGPGTSRFATHAFPGGRASISYRLADPAPYTESVADALRRRLLRHGFPFDPALVTLESHPIESA